MQDPPSVKVPPLVSDVKLTVPVGIVSPLAEVSLTNTVQIVDPPIKKVSGEHPPMAVAVGSIEPWGCSGLGMMFS